MKWTKNPSQPGVRSTTGRMDAYWRVYVWIKKDNSDSAPKRCVFARAGISSEEEETARRRKVEKEEAEGSTQRCQQTHIKPFGIVSIPTVGRRTVLIPKGHGSGEWWLIVNRSARGGGAWHPAGAKRVLSDG